MYSGGKECDICHRQDGESKEKEGVKKEVGGSCGERVVRREHKVERS